jgi:hypothetical protein
MAIVVGNKTYANPVNLSTSSYTFAHNQNVGNGKYLLVCVCMPNTVDFTTATYNGVAMTLLLNFNSTSLSQRWAVFGLATTNTGSNNVVVNFSGTQWNSISVAAISFTSCAGARLIGNDNISTTPNSKTNKYNLNSRIFALGVSGTNQSNPYTVNGSNVALEFTHNVGSIVSAILSNPLTSYGDVVVNTIANVGGSISNTRIEILDYTAGLVAINTEISGNRITLNEFKKGLIAINTDRNDNRVFNTFVKGFIGITTEVTPSLNVQNKTEISNSTNL